MKTLLRICVVLLPWRIRRWVLVRGFGYEIHPTARIGLSWIFPRHLKMGESSRIGHCNVAIHLDHMEVGAHAIIECGNWITGCPKNAARHFAHQPGRDPALIVGAHATIMENHHLDCTDRIEIGAFTILAGYRSQILTHSIDVVRNRQDAAPVRIGDHCFVGTAVVVLGGARLPNRSVLGAKALLNHAYEQPDWLYGGVPARPIQALPPDAAYFRRTTGSVN